MSTTMLATDAQPPAYHYRAWYDYPGREQLPDCIEPYRPNVTPTHPDAYTPRFLIDDFLRLVNSESLRKEARTLGIIPPNTLGGRTRSTSRLYTANEFAHVVARAARLQKGALLDRMLGTEAPELTRDQASDIMNKLSTSRASSMLPSVATYAVRRLYVSAIGLLVKALEVPLDENGDMLARLDVAHTDVYADLLTDGELALLDVLHVPEVARERLRVAMARAGPAAAGAAAPLTRARRPPERAES
ncbi:hypothetical protein GGF32_000734 [Allomyces javanicus]|nr:hypothetical protein GGF32_000734 [Allomyces javanicus]